jgi:hypothetical protein
LWLAAFTIGLIGSQVSDDASRGLYCAAFFAAAAALVHQRFGVRLQSVECQVRKLQARDEARAEGENLVIQFARGAQPRVGHPAGNGNGHGPA